MKTIEYIWKGEDLVFTFKHEAKEFAEVNGLKIKYKEADLIEEEHYQVIGYKSKLFWYLR